jgi:hypothetical protein
MHNRKPRPAIRHIAILTFTFVILTCVHRAPVAAQEPTVQDKFDAITSKLTDHTYSLRYKFRPGDTLLYEVIHQVSVKTLVQGTSQESQSRSKSRKSWKIDKSDAPGTTILTHSVDYVDMWSKTSGRQPIQYDSRSDEQAPSDYENIAKMVKKPLSIVTVDAFGKVLERDDKIPQFDMGTGGMTVPLPNKPVKLGSEWSTPGLVRVRQSDGIQKAIKTRQLYRLEKVETGIATISLNTEVLTPVDEPRIESQLIQRLSNGTIKFDIDAGVVRSRRLEWDETVVGFNGPESSMTYVARLTESLAPSKVARAAQ